jgi:hypothetical protein
MIRFIVATAAALGLAAGPARAADTISLRPGEAVTVVIDDGGRASVEEGGAARPMSDEDKAMVRDLLVNHPEAFGPRAAIITAGEGKPVPSVSRGEVHFSFMTFGEGNDRLLIVENGYGRGLRYRAIMHRNGRAEPTDVCIVIPERRSYEHWSYPIERIDLSAIALVPYRDGEVPTCE